MSRFIYCCGVCHYAVCRVLFIVVVCVILLNVGFIFIVMLSVIALNVIMLSVIMLSVIMLNAIILTVVMLVLAPQYELVAALEKTTTM